MKNKLNIDIYADGAYVEEIQELKDKYQIAGITTNPTLMAKAGVTNYLDFAQKMIKVADGLPISFEVFADDFDEMYEQAKILSMLGDNVYVKIPITNTLGEFSYNVIEKLNRENVKLNITAIFTFEQIASLYTYINYTTDCIISIFAGRISDVGYNAEIYIKYAIDVFKDKTNAKILWASTREIYNIVQADDLGCHIITVPNNMLPKLADFGKDLAEFSLETVKMFRNDALKSGLSI